MRRYVVWIMLPCIFTFQVGAYDHDAHRWFSDAFGYVEDVIEQASETVQTVFEEDIADFFENDIPNLFEEVGQRIADAFEDGWGATRQAFKVAAEKTGGVLSDHWSDIVDAAEDIYGKTRDGALFLRTVIEQRQHHITPEEVQPAFIEPDDTLRLNEAMFLGSHNGYAYSEIYDLYYQHEEDVATQFQFGARSFELDTYDYNGDVYLCHRKCEGPRAFAITGSCNPDVDTFISVLQQFDQLLDENPESIIMIYLENKADPKNVAKAIEKVPQLKDKLLLPDEWSLEEHDGHWPTLGWMRENNKRAVLFSTNFEGNPYAWRLWGDAKENYCCTTDLDKLCELRGNPDGNPRFYFMKYFDKMTATFSRSKELHSKERMQKAIDKCAKEGIKDIPNVILIDRSESVMDMWNNNEPSIMNIINEHNAKQAEANKKATK